MPPASGWFWRRWLGSWDDDHKPAAIYSGIAMNTELAALAEFGVKECARQPRDEPVSGCDDGWALPCQQCCDHRQTWCMD
jgi:hypothetical protein